MAKQRKPVHKVEMTDGKRAIIQQLFQEYDIENANDIQEALKDLLGGTIKQMMESEMDEHLGYSKSERSDSDNARNGHKPKRVNSSLWQLPDRCSPGSQVLLCPAGRQEAPKGYFRHRPENHFHVRQGDDYQADF